MPVAVEETVDPKIDPQHRIEGDVAIAAARQCLRQRIAHLAGHHLLQKMAEPPKKCVESPVSTENSVSHDAPP